MPFLTRNNKIPLGIYVHVPFCRSKCQYCDFYSRCTKEDKVIDGYLDAVCDHIFRMLELDTTGAHISLGGDLDGCDALPEGFEGVQSYNALADRLHARGLDEKTIRNIYWNNTMGVMDRAVRNHKK